MRWLLVLAALAGCDQVFGIDHHAPADAAPAPIDMRVDAPEGSMDLDGDDIPDELDRSR